MNVKFRLFFWFILVLIQGSAGAQSYKISYEMAYKADSLDPNVKKVDAVLLVDGAKSAFLNRKHFESDSIAQNTAPQNGLLPPRTIDVEHMVFKDHEKKTYSDFMFLLRDLYEVKKPLKTYPWQITSETKTLGQYTVQKALLSHSNREWEAWFTTEIPLQEGPSVFYGLPGLILQMQDSKGHYEFTFSGITKLSDLQVHFLAYQPLILTPAQRKKVLREYYADPYKSLKAIQMRDGADENAERSTPNYPEMTRAMQKRLRSQNNPIELDEAIAFPKN